MRGTLVLAGVVVTALLACRAKTTGSLTVDGAAYEIDSCKSGQANIPRFDGVDFLDASGRRVRFLLESTGNVKTYLFAPGATTGDMIGESCGTLTLQQQNSEVNGVKNVKGAASLNCTGSGHNIVASLNFENCH